VAREAARWLLRLDSAHATAADLQACERWRARSGEHERAWQRAQAVRQAFGAIPPTLGMAALQRPGNARRKALKAFLGLAVMPPALWVAARENGGGLADHRTAVGERREVMLADGSRVLLNTATRLDAAVSAAMRTLRLHEGEIYVHGAAQPGVPLALHTPFGLVQSEGPVAYGAQLHPDGCEVDVTSGETWLTPLQAPQRALRLATGQHAMFDRQAVSAPNTADPLRLDWTRGVLHARDMRLDAFIAELARYRHGMLRCDPAVGGLRLSGTFQLDNIDGALQALPALLPVRMRSYTPYFVHLVPAARA